MKIVVTGAYGQLGNEIKTLSGNFPSWQFFFRDVDTLDITNEKEVEKFISEIKPDILVNCAAYTAVDKAESDFENAKNVNETAPAILSKLAKIHETKFIHISTDYVFNGEASEPYTEIDAVNPKSIYGKTKLKGEQNCLAENPDSIIIRTSWLYSSFGNNFVKTMLRLGNERNKLNVVFDQIGTPTYAADLAFAVVSIIEKYEINVSTFVPGIYHYSNEGVASWYDFAKEFLK